MVHSSEQVIDYSLIFTCPVLLGKCQLYSLFLQWIAMNNTVKSCKVLNIAFILGSVKKKGFKILEL